MTEYPVDKEMQLKIAIMDLAINSGIHDQVYSGSAIDLNDDIADAYKGIQALLRLVGDNPEREGVIETPKRFIKAFMELNSGLLENPADHLTKNFNIQDADEELPIYDEIIVSGGIPFNSMCEHHLLPFTGTIDIGYIPNSENGRIVGLSKLARMADGYARRPQVQERLTVQIEHAITSTLNPLGVAVIVRGKHTCQCMRGVKKDGFMATSRMTGRFREVPEARMEFLELIKRA